VVGRTGMKTFTNVDDGVKHDYVLFGYLLPR
jgi:hypothetical protein